MTITITGGISLTQGGVTSATVLPVVAPETVPVTAGLAVQLDAENSTFTFSGGSSITQWQDLSGNGNHADSLLAANGFTEPVLDDGTLGDNPNSRPFVTNRNFNFGFNILNSDSITVKDAFFVTRRTNALWVDFGGWINPDAGGSYWIFGPNGTKQLQSLSFDSFFQNNTEYATSEAFGVDLDVWAIYHMRSSAGLTSGTGFNLLHLEDTLSFPARSWLGDVAEMLIYDTTLSAGNMTSVLDYLADKYAITIA